MLLFACYTSDKTMIRVTKLKSDFPVSGSWVESRNEAMQTRSSSSPSAGPVPHRVQFRESQLQIVDSTSCGDKILPGSTVVSQPRSSGKAIVDTHMIEPGTGRLFTSLEAVHRHLAGEVNDKRLTRAGSFFQDKTRIYEGSRTKQAHRSVEYASKGFKLPKGWSVEEAPRKNSSHIDKYYVERRTGKRFRSLVSAERYIKENGIHADEQLMLLKYPRKASKGFTLPDGWIVEKKPRRNSSHVDRSYIEPGTGKKFRSMAAVERYLQTAGNSTVDSVSMMQSERLALLMYWNVPGFETEVIDPKPPEKVKWVFTGPSGNMFSPYMNVSDVSSSDRQKWSEAFVTLIQDRF